MCVNYTQVYLYIHMYQNKVRVHSLGSKRNRIDIVYIIRNNIFRRKYIGTYDNYYCTLKTTSQNNKYILKTTI